MARSAYSSSARASTTTLSGEPPNDSFEARGVSLVERGPTLRIDVEHGREGTAAIEHRNHDLRLGSLIASDMAWKPRHIGNHDRAPFGRRCATHPAAERDFETSERSLVGADPEKPGRHDAVEPR